jgi:hypothetical protein
MNLQEYRYRYGQDIVPSMGGKAKIETKTEKEGENEHVYVSHIYFIIYFIAVKNCCVFIENVRDIFTE